MRTVTFFGLCSRAAMNDQLVDLLLIGAPFYPVEQTFDSAFGCDLPCSRQRFKEVGNGGRGLFIGWGEAEVARAALGALQRDACLLRPPAGGGRDRELRARLPRAARGDLNGFILLRGDAEKLASLRAGEFTQFATRATLTWEFRHRRSGSRRAAPRQMEFYTEQIGAFA